MSQTEAVITDNPFESDADDDETNAEQESAKLRQTEAVITDNLFESDEDYDETNANEIVIDSDIGSAGEDGKSEQDPDDESDSSHDGE